MTSIAIEHKQAILQQLSDGDTLSVIASRLGISQPALSKQLAHDPEYTEAKLLAIESRLTRWEDEIEGINASTPQVMVARTREGMSQARWRAEVMCPQVYGKQASVIVQVNPAQTLDTALYGRAMDMLTPPISSSSGNDVPSGGMGTTPSLLDDTLSPDTPLDSGTI